ITNYYNTQLNKMKVFISWSKHQSMEMAIKTKELLEKLNPKINAFVSEVDINGGQDVQIKILEKIKECDKLVLCFTKENKKAPWLLFEAGFARGLNRTVIPFLFDDDPNWHSWIDNPMNVAREIKFNHDGFNKTFLTSFDLKETPDNERKIDDYKKSILRIKENFRSIDTQCEDLIDKLIHNEAFVLENPFFKDKAGYFLSGFESYELFKVIIESFLYTGKHLWIYGRKNMKLFGGSFKNFFKYLHEKTTNNPGMDGIDFRCLFLDPNSDEVKKAHIQQHIFKFELEATLLRAKDEVRDNDTLRNCFKLYSNKRESIIIRLDESIIYCRPSFDSNGFPQLLTNTGFEVFSTNSKKGKKCLKIYENVWNNAKAMPENFEVF
ncbi:toll/interleukin-1 receptor domain-containing protein, partial [Croceitalea marina]